MARTVHGPGTRSVYPCARPGVYARHGPWPCAAGRVQGRVHHRVLGPCTAVYGPCPQPCYGRVHGRLHSRGYSIVHSRVHCRILGRARPCTDRVHSRVTAVSTAGYTAVDTALYTAVYTAVSLAVYTAMDRYQWKARIRLPICD